MTTDFDRIKDRIRQMLAIAENDAAAQGEIDNAIRFATQLMTKHNLTRDDVTVDGDDEAASSVTFSKAHTYTVGANYSYWERWVVDACRSLVGTVDVYYTSHSLRRRDGRCVLDKNGKRQKATRLTFYGPQEDAQFAADLFDEIATTIAAMARLRWGGVFRGDGGSYCEGFAIALFLAQKKERQNLAHKADKQTRALTVRSMAIATRLKSEARDWLKGTGVKLMSASKTYGVSQLNSEAYDEGRRDGRKYSIPGRERRRRIEH